MTLTPELIATASTLTRPLKHRPPELFSLVCKSIRFATIIVLLALSNSNVGTAEVLYDGSLGTLPGSQGWSYGTNPFLGASASQTLDATGVALNSTAVRTEQAGYFSINPIFTSIKHAGVPTLDRHSGFTLRFDLQISSEGHNVRDDNNDGLDDRAGFSVIVVSDDLKALELGFWQDEVWAYDDDSQLAANFFTYAEGALLDTTAAVLTYHLTFDQNSYRLNQGNQQILTGSLRDYTNFNGSVNPYQISNMIFLGDDTSSADSTSKLNLIEIDVRNESHWLGNSAMFETNGNWNSDIPQLADRALIGLSSTAVASATISLSADRTNSTLQVGNVLPANASRYVLNLGSQRYTLTDQTTIDIAGALQLRGSGTLDTRQLQNNGALFIDTTTTVKVQDLATNSGTLALHSATLYSENSALVNEAGGTLKGDGTVHGNVVNQGTIAPGLFVENAGNFEEIGAGMFTIDGDFEQTAAATLVISIAGNAGPSVAGGHDSILISQSAAIDGTLQIELLDNFTPSAGDSFQLLAASSLSGTFANATADSNGAGKVLFDGNKKFDILYDSVNHTVTLDNYTVLTAGDIDANGSVDALDLAEFLKHFGKSSDSTFTTGDFNFDGKTTLADLLLLKQNFSAPSPALLSVPEPSSIILLIVSTFCFFGRFAKDRYQGTRS